MTTRRDFLTQMASGLALAALLPPALHAQPADDTQYVQGLLDAGKTVPVGRYRVSAPLRFPHAGSVMIGCVIESSALCMVVLLPEDRGVCRQNFFRYVGPPIPA